MINIDAFAAVELSASENIEVIGEKKISDVVSDDDDENEEDSSEVTASFSRLDPFKNIVVFQKRYLPKRHRLEANFALGVLSDNPFFVTTVFHARLGYAFTEAFGFELSYFSAATSESQVTENLLEQGGIDSQLNDVPESYLGVDVRWTPMYGKISFFNKSIIPIDNYYLVGVGKTQLAGEESPLTLHGAAGLSFALKRWLALRLEFAIYAYSTEGSGSYTDSHFNIGLSTFLPGVGSR